MAFKSLPHYKVELATMFAVDLPLKNKSSQRAEFLSTLCLLPYYWQSKHTAPQFRLNCSILISTKTSFCEDFHSVACWIHGSKSWQSHINKTTTGVNYTGLEFLCAMNTFMDLPKATNILSRSFILNLMFLLLCSHEKRQYDFRDTKA